MTRISTSDWAIDCPVIVPSEKVTSANVTSAIVAATLLCAAAGGLLAEENVQLRGSLDNCRIRFERHGVGHVAFMGGSITQMNGYRPMVCESLQTRFSETVFEFTAAGISSTCSTTGAMRLASDVFTAGPVDLFFIEFAVNDDQDAGHARRECLRGVEGILQQCFRHNPKMDVVITFFVNPEMLDLLQAGQQPVSIAAHADVAAYYGVSTIHLAREVAERISAGTLTWQEYGGTHPKPAGNRICAEMIDQLFTKAWTKPLASSARASAHPLPAKPLDSGSYGRGRFIDTQNARVDSGWVWNVPAWKSLPGTNRSRFNDLKMLHAEHPGAELTLPFTGRAVGAYLLAGPDAGIVETSIDGGSFVRHDLYHRFSRGLHYPRTVMFATDLEPGSHRLTLRISPERHEQSTGHAARVMQFVAN